MSRSYVISFVCVLKYQYSCFSSYFCSLLLLLCWSISYLRCFWSPYLVFNCMKSSSPHVDASTLSSMLASPLPPSFLDIYSLSMSSHGYKAFRIMSFLSFDLFLEILPASIQKRPRVSYKRTAQMFVPLIKFSLQSLLSRNFVVCLWFSSFFFFFFFLSAPLVWWSPLLVFSSTLS